MINTEKQKLNIKNAFELLFNLCTLNYYNTITYVIYPKVYHYGTLKYIHEVTAAAVAANLKIFQEHKVVFDI